MFQRKHRFHQTRRACACEQMTDIRFDAANHALIFTPTGITPKLAQTGEFDRVANGRAGSMAFNQIHILRLPARRRVCRSHGAKLAFSVRRKQIALPVVRQTDSANHGVNRVAVANRVVKPFQDEHARAFANDKAVVFRVKWGACAGRRQRAKLAEAHLRKGAVRAADAAGQHGVGASGLQFHDGEIQGIERRRARAIHRETPAAKPERLRHDSGDHADGVAIDRIFRENL